MKSAKFGAGWCCPTALWNGNELTKLSATSFAALRVMRRVMAPLVVTITVACLGTGPSWGEDAPITADDVASLINGEEAARAAAVQGFIKAYTVEHGCSVFEFSQREFASGMPWGRALAEWTGADVSAFKRVGLECIATDPRNDADQQRELSQSFNYQFEGLEREVDQARADRALAVAEQQPKPVAPRKPGDTQAQLAKDMAEFVNAQGSLSDETALAQASELLLRMTPLGAVTLDQLWELEPLVREIRDRRRAAVQEATADRAAAPVADQLRDWLATYRSMSATDALASANRLLGLADSLGGADYTEEIWELTGQVLEARSTLEASGPADTYLAGIRPACYRALSELGHNENWADYPVWFDEPDFNMGDFLCWFLRTRTLGHVEIGQGTIEIAINDVTLQFAPQKNVATDDYYANPDSKVAGKVKFAIVTVTWGSQMDRLTTFNQHLQIITLAMTQQGAPFVE